ncbi:tetratricopeptide repeat protein [Archangium violaceum]|uniref:tetratricopeptide repeat protein n=1 Tax=Archangium violaceum TaxID=83451 RepID=UPI00193BE234|nr:tetratricopeptide repeat protein [Archangium violaceum]QRK10367.1 tetratricopeptide repeat protein [Archangium violaceum]
MPRLQLPGGLLLVLLAGAGCTAGRAHAPTSASASDAYEDRLERARLGLRGSGREAALSELETLAHELETQLEKSPREARLHALLARTAFLLNQEEKALAEAERSLALKPDQAEPHFIKAFVLGSGDAVEAALASARRATELDSRQGRYWQLLGTLYIQLDKPAEARGAIDKTLALEPNNAQALFLIGLLHMEQGRHLEALDAYEKAREVEPAFAMAHYNAGQIQQLKGNHAAALERFQKAAELEPQDWRTRAKLVQLHQALGHKEQRDAEREALLLLRQAGKVDKEYFIREQFSEAGRNVMVVENFELEGDWARRYEFQVYTPDQERPSLVISLGSYSFANTFAREKDPNGPRLFHLDGYHPDNAHDTYGFFQGEPSYDETREMVLSVLRGELKPMSSTKPGKP